MRPGLTSSSQPPLSSSQPNRPKVVPPRGPLPPLRKKSILVELAPPSLSSDSSAGAMNVPPVSAGTQSPWTYLRPARALRFRI